MDKPLNHYIAFTAPGKAEFLEEKYPEINADQAVVALSVSSVSSGTERSKLLGEENTSIYKYGKLSFPVRSGYSSSGRVFEVGENVKDFAVGDRVAVYWSQHSQYCRVKPNQLIKLPDNVSDSDAALAHIACFPLAAIRKCRLEIGESAAVMGLGILGLLGVKLLKCAGAAPIIAVDPVQERRELALKMGADFALDPYEKDFAEKAVALSDGGVKVGIEVTGVGAGLNGILDIMAPFGRVALLGCTRNSDFTVDYYHKVHGRGITMVGAHTLARPQQESSSGWWTTADDMRAVIKLISLGRMTLSDLVKRTCSPKDCASVYGQLATEQAFPFTQFDWSDIR